MLVVGVLTTMLVCCTYARNGSHGMFCVGGGFDADDCGKRLNEKASHRG